ncbi:hypothetical protein C8A03DRAFT_46922 [Achaetomium macrosporum]|uniref:Uncharacterized protein n=1 Tax=Achaetomium macrosporum TaxID=79813 RepID=A0AAN7HB68_9PEZI|nr:hypothetical protein C8A03DRAFT_46922 [Achaetomium macrosporum]
MTRVVPRQKSCYAHARQEEFSCTPRPAPCKHAMAERGLAQNAASASCAGPPHHTFLPWSRVTRTTRRFDHPDASPTMSLDWTHQFCLGCDKQTDGATYCSESCRLADYEKTSPSTPSSAASSPALSSPPLDWTPSRPSSATSNRKFYLSPAYEFGSTAQTTSSRRDSTRCHTLSPSASHTSLCSMRSNSSVAGLDAAQLSEKAARELRAYARSFESVRLQRRRSY